MTDATAIDRARRPSAALPRSVVSVRVIDSGAHEARIARHTERVQANAPLMAAEEAEVRQRGYLRRARAMARRRNQNHGE